MGSAPLSPEAAPDTSTAAITSATPEDVFPPLNGVDPVTHPDEWYLEYLKMIVRAKTYATLGTTPRIVRHWQDLAVTLAALAGRTVPIPAGKAALTRDWLLDGMMALNEAPAPRLTEREWAARYDAVPTDLGVGKHSFAASCVDQLDILVVGALLAGHITTTARSRLWFHSTTAINRLGVVD